jgi:tRNA(Arg) A34 adenosine deaminase TadA
VSAAYSAQELESYVRQVVDLAVEHVARGGAPFTALVVGDGQVLGAGANREREDRDPTAHAEVVALRAAAREHGTRATAGSLLVASGEPCALCYLTALWCGVGQVVFAADRHTAAGAGYDYRRSYRVFATDPLDWPLPVFAIPVSDADKPFRTRRGQGLPQASAVRTANPTKGEPS